MAITRERPLLVPVTAREGFETSRRALTLLSELQLEPKVESVLSFASSVTAPDLGKVMDSGGPDSVCEVTCEMPCEIPCVILRTDDERRFAVA